MAYDRTNHPRFDLPRMTSHGSAGTPAVPEGDEERAPERPRPPGGGCKARSARGVEDAPAGMRVNLRVFSHQWNHPLRLRHGGKGELQNGDCRNRRQSFRLASIPTMLSTWRSWRHPIPALDFSNSRSFDGFALPAQRRHKAVKSRSRLLRASVPLW